MSYQLITIVGNVGKDAEMRYLKDGTAVANFNVAVSKVTGRGETRQEKTTWFKVTVWRERAETAVQYIKKGMKILVTGEVDASAYTDKTSGEPRASLEITARDFQFLSSRAEMEGSSGGGGGEGQYAPQNARGGGRGGNQQYAAQDEGDIPF
jgi:single-strand DNA-binding protein